MKPFWTYVPSWLSRLLETSTPNQAPTCPPPDESSGDNLVHRPMRDAAPLSQRASAGGTSRRDTLFNLQDQRLASWQDRAYAACDLVLRIRNQLPSPVRIADLGCGDRKLLHALTDRIPGLVQYTGYDLHPQDSSVIALDLNHASPGRDADVAFALGVLEYIEDLPSCLTRLRLTASYIIASYVCADCEAYTPDDVRALGWKHHLTRSALKRLFETVGFTCLEMIVIDGGKTHLWLLSTHTEA